MELFYSRARQIPIAFRNNANADIATITSTGVINASLKLQEAGVDISTNIYH
jgi:hypothetical protein